MSPTHHAVRAPVDLGERRQRTPTQLVPDKEMVLPFLAPVLAADERRRVSTVPAHRTPVGPDAAGTAAATAAAATATGIAGIATAIADAPGLEALDCLDHVRRAPERRAPERSRFPLVLFFFLLLLLLLLLRPRLLLLLPALAGVVVGLQASVEANEPVK